MKTDRGRRAEQPPALKLSDALHWAAARRDNRPTSKFRCVQEYWRLSRLRQKLRMRALTPAVFRPGIRRLMAFPYEGTNVVLVRGGVWPTRLSVLSMTRWPGPGETLKILATALIVSYPRGMPWAPRSWHAGIPL